MASATAFWVLLDCLARSRKLQYQLRSFLRVKMGAPCYHDGYFTTFGRCEGSVPFLKFVPFLVNVLERGSNLLCRRCPSTYPFFFPSSSVSFSPFSARPQPTRQSSLLFYLDSPFSGRPCHPHHLLVLNYPPLVPTTRQNMSAAQNSLSLNVNTATDIRKTSLPNLSYPIRPPMHAPWAEPSVPLVVKACCFRWALLP
jgi:hypothetical protein